MPRVTGTTFRSKTTYFRIQACNKKNQYSFFFSSCVMALSLAVAAAGSTLLLSYYYYYCPRHLLSLGTLLYPDVITNFNAEGKQIALTIDDAPSIFTNQLLQLLDEHNIRATLFVISNQISEHNRELLIEAVRRGHLLGNYGREDKFHALLSKEDFISEVMTCDKAINSIYEEAGVGRSCKVFRPGGGLFNTCMIKFLNAVGYKLVLGSVYPHDPHIRSSAVNSFFIRWKLQPGDIVIVHDREWTVDLFNNLLSWILSQHYKFVTLDAIL